MAGAVASISTAWTPSGPEGPLTLMVRDDWTTESNATWMPRERLDALIRGDDCPLCQPIETDVVPHEFGHTLVHPEFSRLRLSRNQYVRGY